MAGLQPYNAISPAGVPRRSNDRPVQRWLILGLDGATYDVFNPLMDAGRMPNLQRLIREWVSGTLLSTKPVLRDRFVVVLTKADYDKLRREEGLDEAALGPAETTVSPSHTNDAPLKWPRATARPLSGRFPCS